jgi:hypothetical protein
MRPYKDVMNLSGGDCDTPKVNFTLDGWIAHIECVDYKWAYKC